MKSTIIFIASRITDSKQPLADRAALCRWARGTAWAREIEATVHAMALDQRYREGAKN